MNEFTTTRSNHLIDPSMHIWGWEIPVYLFLGGLVAGMMIISGYLLLRGRNREADCLCLYFPWMSLGILSAGMFALFLDLEFKAQFWRLYTTFQITSPMSWGSWILIIVYPALITNGLINLPQTVSERAPWMERISVGINNDPRTLKTIGIVNIFLGVLLGMYTGILLSSLGARPLWDSAVLWLLFLISGLSTAAAFAHLVAKNVYERELMAKTDNYFLIVEIMVVATFIFGALSSTQVHINAIQIILTGPYAAAFWVFVVALGMLVPLIIQLNAVNHRVQHTALAPIMVITGGLILRFVIVYAGQLSHWADAAL